MHCAGGSEQSVYKGNPETEEWRLVASLAPVESGPPGGIFISRQYGLGWTLHVLVNDHLNVRGDRIDIWQLGTYRDWMALDPAAGQVPSRQRVSVNINFTAVGLMPDTYEGSLRIHHNAREGLFTIPVHLEVLSVGVKSETALELPDHFDLEAAYPNPFNAEVVLNIQLPVDSEVRLQVFDLTGRLTAELLNGRMPAGEHQSVWSAQKQPSGVYWCRFEAGGVVRMQKLAVVR